MKTLTLTLLLLGSSFAHAQSPTTAPKADASRGSDKLDIKKLETKYWSAKDDDFSVVQNRRYTKAGRYFVSVSGGVPFNDPFASGTMIGANLGYFFNERWGIDLEYKSGSLKDNDATSLFISRYGVYPDHNIFQSSEILSATLVPFYAKMSFMDTSIIYFDMGLSVGAGTLNYTIKKSEGDETRSTPAVKLGVFQQVFFTENFALRAELSNTWSNQTKFKYYSAVPIGTNKGDPITDRDQGAKTVNDTSLMVGLTYWF